MRLIPLIRELARPGFAVALSAAGPLVGATVGLGVAYAYADALREGGLGIAGLLLVVGALGCGLLLLPTHALSLVCGWALGPVGVLVALAGAALGAPVGYGLGRALAGPGLVELIGQNAKGARVCAAVASASPGRAAFLVGLLRLSPVVPYGTTNVLSAVFAVPMVPFVAGTVLGLAPRVAAAVMIGAGLERLDGQQQGSPWMWAVGIGATVLAAVLMGWYARRALGRVADQPVVGAS